MDFSHGHGHGHGHGHKHGHGHGHGHGEVVRRLRADKCVDMSINNALEYVGVT
jgi:hypothetical protein